MAAQEILEKHRIPRIDLELSAACDHKCGHCYNVWNASEEDARPFELQSQLSTPELIAMMDRMVGQTGAEHVTVTGGEPMLHRDALEILAAISEMVPSLQLITNGSHVPPETAAAFAQMGMRSVQLTLLAGDRDTHDRLKGAESFDDTLRAILNLRDAGVPAQVCFVAMAENADEFEAVMELCAVLEVSSVAYNRMAPTGWAIHHIARLMPTVEQIESNLETAERLGRAWGIRVSTAMPIPPCLIRIERYSWVRFGFCSTGSSSPNIVVDASGRVRSCNLASGVLGNILDQDWADIHANPYQREFKRTVPNMCRGCAYERSCQGGCKESGAATFGSMTHPEPLVWLAQDPQRREALSAQVEQFAAPDVPRGSLVRLGRGRSDDAESSTDPTVSTDGA